MQDVRVQRRLASVATSAATSRKLFGHGAGSITTSGRGNGLSLC